MQYILTQEEYDDLKRIQKNVAIEGKAGLQQLCTKIANEMPVNWGWGDPVKEPWGCILTKDDWYCDECPVQKICPREWKSWSK